MSDTINIKEVALIGRNLRRAKKIATLSKVIAMKAKFYAENADNVHSVKLDNILKELTKIELRLK